MHLHDPEDILDLVRHYAKKGWRPKREERKGGLILPYDQHDTFDFSLLGGYVWQPEDQDEPVVIHGGNRYKRRILEAVDSKKMKMPAAVKYSRGAKPTDPEHLIEKGDGEFGYVTLVIFKGKGAARPELSLPGGQRHIAALDLGAQAAD